MKYIVYTTDGYTELPTGVERENCQIVDFVEDTAETASDIKARYVKQAGIRPDSLMVVPFVDDKTVKAIQDVLSYLWEDEERHYEEWFDENSDIDNSNNSQNHIFISLKTIAETFGL